MRTCSLVVVLLCVSTGLMPGCSTRRVGIHTAVARPGKGVVRVEGSRQVLGEASDTGYTVRVVRVDGKPARGSQLVLDPGTHQIQLSWSRLEMPDPYSQGLGHDLTLSARWVKTAGGCCTVDVDVMPARVYTLVWDEQRSGRCPFRVVEVPQCP